MTHTVMFLMNQGYGGLFLDKCSNISSFVTNLDSYTWIFFIIVYLISFRVFNNSSSSDENNFHWALISLLSLHLLKRDLYFRGNSFFISFSKSAKL